MKEADVQKWVQEQIKAKFPKELYIFKVPQGQYVSRRGIPDLVMSLKGRFVAIEVKMPRGTLTRLQEKEIKDINNAGALAFTIYGKDPYMMKAFLDDVEKWDAI